TRFSRDWSSDVCSSDLTSHPEPSASTAPAAPAPKLAPLTGISELTALVVPGYRDAIVSVPLGAFARRPVVLALHGNYERPEWQRSEERRVGKECGGGRA